MNIIKECALHEPCAYIDGNSQSIHYKIIHECSTSDCEALILRGWRRFGSMYFRPICSECKACESLKIDARHYSFSKSERRVLRKNSHLTTIVRHPTLTREHLNLFDRYHTYKHHTRSWDAPKVDPKNYYASFVQGHGDFGYEILYFEGEKLIAVDLIDILNEGISALYCYYDPDYYTNSLGRYTLLEQIALTQRLGLKWVYLGYYVEQCQSLAYKGSYTPSLCLNGRPEENEQALWDNFIPLR
ncbi:arginyltransferase [Sulfuricurvum sp.]|uniref:arginyltransferase n=1 Tax=Sulfuricurvum sp. TaxID=2025608 RepID=UPI0026074FF4|nr:arginyltransferase [Sulfuricurvum sp.]MDD4883738.1 arginyltransferase [Sulfuricurvum sp.]